MNYKFGYQDFIGALMEQRFFSGTLFYEADEISVLCGNLDQRPFVAMTKILHISNTDIESDSRIRKELIALGRMPAVRISVVGVSNSNEPGDVEIDAALYRKLRITSRGLRVLPRAISYFFELIEFTIKAVKAARQLSPDIVHCHDTFALPTGWILKRIFNCKLVYDAHELESKKNAQNVILSCATLWIEKFCWKQVDLLISVSDSIIDWYVRNLGSKPTALVLNSPAIAASPDARFNTHGRINYFQERYAIPKDDLIFVYLGVVGPGRGVDICLDAFADGPKGAHVVFIGFGSLEKKINEYAVAHSNIHFHHAVPHDQVVPLVRGADYGLCLIENVSLSDYYCLPNKLFEYCFARIPVIASNFPEISRLVDQYSLGVCCEPSSDRVRAELRRLVEHRPSRSSSDLTTLSWEAQAERLRSAYIRQLMVN